MRKLNTTAKQRALLHYLRSVDGKARLTELPCVVGTTTVKSAAEHGLVSVFVKITQKGFEQLHEVEAAE